MNAVYVMVITHRVLIVTVLLMEMLCLIIVMYVIMTHQMIVPKIVLVNGVVYQM